MKMLFIGRRRKKKYDKNTPKKEKNDNNKKIFTIFMFSHLKFCKKLLKIRRKRRIRRKIGRFGLCSVLEHGIKIKPQEYILYSNFHICINVLHSE